MRLLLGFLKPTQGSLEIAGLPAGSKELAGKIAYVPQSLQDLNFHFPASLREIVAGNLYPLGRAWRRKERQRRRKMVEESLAMVGLEDHTEDHLDMLSGGQVQRVLLARAMISKPKILFLDEPTAGIDHQGAEDFYHILKQLSDEENMTILLITHDLYRIKDFCERFLCLGPKGFFEVHTMSTEAKPFFKSYTVRRRSKWKFSLMISCEMLLL